MSHIKKEIRVVVVGDEKVGKTSLITNLITGEFQENVPPVLAVATIPPDVNPENVLMRIVDTPSGKEKFGQVEEEIKKADSICLVYAAHDDDSLIRVKDYWLPELKRILENSERSKMFPPIILVGNKKDLVSEEYSKTYVDVIPSIFEEYSEVETDVLCSTKESYNVEQVFYFAQQAVLYPTQPLYQTNSRKEIKLKAKFVHVLKRIFRQADSDGDEHLDDTEFSYFQWKSFGFETSQEEMMEFKQQISSNFPDGFSSKGLNINGFLYLHHQFASNGNNCTIWTELINFGYGYDLELREDYKYPEIQIKEDSVCEVSSKAMEFLYQLFKRYDKDEDGALSYEELEKLFEFTPNPPQNMERHVVTDDKGRVILQGFLSYWNMQTFLDYKETQRILAYLGFWDYQPIAHMKKSDETNKFKEYGPIRVLSRDNIKERTVFQFFVFGNEGCGKTTFLGGLVGKKKDQEISNQVINSIQIENTEKYILLQEFHGSLENSIQTIHSTENMKNCDLACFMFDGTSQESYDNAQKLMKYLREHNKKMPLSLIHSKFDLKSNILENTQKNQPEPFLISHDNLGPDSYALLLSHLVFPKSKGNWITSISIGVGIILAGGALYYIYKKR